MFYRNVVLIVLTFAASFAFTGCAMIASHTNMLTSAKIKSITSGALGYQPSDLTITSKRIDGTNTYVNLRTTDGKDFTCIINGGNILTLGMTNPPMCNKKGEPINSNPFQR